jgi:hypothetical protein
MSVNNTQETVANMKKTMVLGELRFFKTTARTSFLSVLEINYE